MPCDVNDTVWQSLPTRSRYVVDVVGGRILSLYERLRVQQVCFCFKSVICSYIYILSTSGAAMQTLKKLTQTSGAARLRGTQNPATGSEITGKC